MRYSCSYITELNDLNISSEIMIEKDLISVSTQVTNKRPDPNHGRKESKKEVKFTAENEVITNILQFILSEANPERSTTVSRTFDGKSVTEYTPPFESEKTVSKESDEIEILVGPNAVFFDSESVSVYYNEGGITLEEVDQDLNNLDLLLHGIGEILSNVANELDEDIQRKILNRKYGQNVLQYLEEGDKCMTMNMNTQAILSYVLAAEWAGVTYLNSERDYDLIEEEQESGNWYTFSGKNSVLEKVNEQFKINQTSKQLLDTIYKELRNISAHHTTGDIRDDEVEVFRKRVTDFILELESQTN